MADNVPQPQRPGLGDRLDSHASFAETFDLARQHLNEKLEDLAIEEGESPQLEDSSSPALDSDTTSDPSSPFSGPATPSTAADIGVADDFAFAFDIDGVLIRGGQPIPEAIEAMKVLNGQNEYGIQVPYIFLTNGGGKTEKERCVDLSKQLQIDVSPGQFICGHTPMREMADKYRTVLVVGGEGEKCREVAYTYGFRDVITPGDIIKANASTAPFRKLTVDEHMNSRDLLERGRMSDIIIEAIFVFADSRDWASDLQIILDLAMSKGGRLETRSETFDEGPPIYFSHNDTLWAGQHEHARLGMGALRHIVESTFPTVTGGKTLKTHVFGKPQIKTFQFATRLLQQWREEQHGFGKTKPPSTVYFVGDTPESDIQGTNKMNERAKEEWYSILVKTGIYLEGTEPEYKPRVIVNTVLDAVKHGIDREMRRRAAKQRRASHAEPALITEPLLPLKGADAVKDIALPTDTAVVGFHPV